MYQGKNPTKKILAMLLAALVLTAVLAGCDSKPASSAPGESSPAGESSAPVESSAPPSSQAPASQAPVSPDTPQVVDTAFTVTDMMGVDVTFESTPQTIVTFGAQGVLNTFVECLGCGDRLANKMTSNFESTRSYPHLRLEFAPQTESAPLLVNADGELLIEEILMLDPDLCLTMVTSVADQLRAQGLNVILLDWQEQEDVYIAVRLMGKVLGKEDLAEEYLTYFDSMIGEAERLTSGIPEAEKKTALYGSITNFSQPHIIAEWWISTAGGISVTNDGRPSTESFSYTAEDVLLWDPDVMLVSGLDQIEELKNNVLFTDLTAVVNNDIYCLPTVGHTWGNRTVEQPLTVFWTINKLYPELVSDEDLSEMIYYFYEHFFNYSLTDEQLEYYVGRNT